MATFKRRYTVGGTRRNSRNNSKTKRKGGFTKVQQEAQKLFSKKAVKEAQQIILNGSKEKDILKFGDTYWYSFAPVIVMTAGRNGMAYGGRVLANIRQWVNKTRRKLTKHQQKQTLLMFNKIFKTPEK